MGADFIEHDLHFSSDGALVVMHDPVLDRTARGPAGNCTGDISSKTLEQLKTCDVGSWFNEAHPEKADPSYVGLEILTLEEVFERYGKDVNYYIETKDPRQYPGMEEELLRLINEHHLHREAVTEWRVMIQSFAPASLQKIHALDFDLPLMQLYGHDEAIVETLDDVALYAVAIAPPAGRIDKELVDAAHARCLDVHPWAVDDENEMRNLIDLGVDALFTNYPDRLDAVLGDRLDSPLESTARAAKRNRSCREAKGPALPS